MVKEGKKEVMDQILRGNSKCKGPGQELGLACWSNSLEASQAFMKRGKRVEGNRRINLDGYWEQGDLA